MRATGFHEPLEKFPDTGLGHPRKSPFPPPWTPRATSGLSVLDPAGKRRTPSCSGCSLEGGRALGAIGRFLLPPRGGGAQCPSPLRRGLWLGGWVGWKGPPFEALETVPFPFGFSSTSSPDSLLLLLKENAMDQAPSYTKVHSFASVVLSTLACGI